MRLLASLCLSVCFPYVTTPETLNEFSWILTFWLFTDICWLVLNFRYNFKKLSYFAFCHAHLYTCLEPTPVNTVTTRVALHSERFAWRQAAQRSPLFQTAVSRGPHVSVQYISVSVRLVFDLFKGDSVTFPSTHGRVTSKKHVRQCD